MIYLLAGPIHSGKTTALFRFTTNNTQADGVLQPVVSGKRFLYLISKRAMLQLETDEENKTIQQIGGHRFLTDTFNEAETHLRWCMDNTKRVLIFDEFGKLEIEGRGMRESADWVMEWSRGASDNHLLLVVRDSLLEQFINSYSLLSEEYALIDHTQGAIQL
jgi:nucleoside-triphosphatase THEP1